MNLFIKKNHFKKRRDLSLFIKHLRLKLQMPGPVELLSVSHISQINNLFDWTFTAFFVFQPPLLIMP